MNMIFNASAGTGKTWQVTELYAALVLGQDHEQLPPDREMVPPEKILLMTFTDNAASELRQRVAQKMMEAEAASLRDENGADLGDRARQVLRSLPAVHISTIHAFCAGLLRENALALGLSPAFKTLDDEERDALLDEVLKAVIFEQLERDGHFRDFCEGLSVLGDHDYSLLNTIRGLLEKADSRGLDLSDAESMLPPAEQTVTRQMFEAVRNELENYDLPKTAAAALDALRVFLADFPNLGKLEAVNKFGQAKKVKHLSDELAQLKERFLTEARYIENAETFRAFARCLAASARGFSEAKRTRDTVDFGDQLLYARDLLKGGRVAAPGYEWIIVDEVQDTSRVQCDLIDALWGPQSHLVICGDRKQSIYAWRSADPQVMVDLEAKMAARGGCARIDLKTSFRSKDRVIDAINGLFSGLYEPYDALESRGVLTGERPCVEWLEEADGTTEGEMKAVARRIVLLVDGPAAWRPRYGHDGHDFVEGQSFGYGDILILLKRSTHQPVLEKALRAAGIPYTSGGKGRALFEQQEVRDLLLFLQVLCEPANDLALVGYLRSPLARVPDDQIVRFGWDGETFNHEILRTQFFASGSVAAERLLRYRRKTGEMLPSQLVREMVRETAFDAQLAGQAGGEQKLANFKKALDWMRGVERGGQVLLPDVVRRFEKYIRTAPRSGAAEALLPDPEQNSVTLMTVHGAKGLTKRVCFIPDISFKIQPDKGFAGFSERTLELKVTTLDGTDVESPGWKKAREDDKAVRELESTNVFYVAMTRARDLVVLSGCGTKKPDGWLKQADDFLHCAAPEVLRTVPFGELSPVVTSEPPEPDGPVPDFGLRPLKIPKGFMRRAVTSLVEGPVAGEPGRGESSGEDRRAYGTLGHAVLEELAKNGWEGDIPELVGSLGDGDMENLVGELEAARGVLREETAGADALYAEHSFVLRRGDLILDGSIDLLVRFPDRWKILDYKFSQEPPEVVVAMYTPQLAAYREAVQKLHPGAEVSAALVLIGGTVQLIALRV